MKESAKVVRLTEELQRPEMLIGSTYKIKTPVSDHAMYVTINDILLTRAPSTNSAAPSRSSSTRRTSTTTSGSWRSRAIISAVFRKGGDVTFLVEELKAVFDPRGGYWQPGGRFMPSIIAELGYVIEKHLTFIGIIPAGGAG